MRIQAQPVPSRIVMATGVRPRCSNDDAPVHASRVILFQQEREKVRGARFRNPAKTSPAALRLARQLPRNRGGIPMSSWRSLIVAVALPLAAALATAWPAGPVAAAEDGPRLEHRLFRVEWTVGAIGEGQTRIVGYVYNESEHDAANVQLRISERSEERRGG